MKKNGFAFIETIITVVVLSTSLLYLYNSYSVIIHDEEVRLYYDDVAHIYKTNYIRKFLENYTDLESVKKYSFANSYLITIGTEYKYKKENEEGNLTEEYGFTELSMFNDDEKNKMKDSLSEIVNNFSIYTMVLIDTKMFAECYNPKDTETEDKCNNSTQHLNYNLQNYIKTLSDTSYEYYLVVQYSEKVKETGEVIKCIPGSDESCKSYYASIGF